MRIQMVMAAIGFSVVGLWMSAAGPRDHAAAKAAVAAPVGAEVAAEAAPGAPVATADFGDVLAAGGVPCHAPKRCCERYPGSTLCLNSAQCTAGPCP